MPLTSDDGAETYRYLMTFLHEDIHLAMIRSKNGISAEN
jgi:hypothetical protein